MTATLTLTTPYSTRAPIALSVYAQDTRSFARRVSTAIREFAARKGVAVDAVEYEIVRAKRGGR